MTSPPQPQHHRRTGLEQTGLEQDYIDTLASAGRPDLALMLSWSFQQVGHARHRGEAGLTPPQLFGPWDPQFAASPSASAAPFQFPTTATTTPGPLALDSMAAPAPDLLPILGSDLLWSSASFSANPGTANTATIQDKPEHQSYVAESTPLGLSADSNLVEPLPSQLMFPEPLACVPTAQWPQSPGLCLETPSQRSSISRVPTATTQALFDGLYMHNTTSSVPTLTPSNGSSGYPMAAIAYSSGVSAIQLVTETSGLGLPDVEVSIDQPERFDMCTLTQDAFLTANAASIAGHLPMVTSSNPADDVDPARGSSPGSESGRSLVARKPISSVQTERARTHRRDIKNVNKPSKGKKSGPLAARERAEAKQTRKNKACARCYLNKMKCFANEDDPNGICITCTISNPNTYILPCIRLKITDIMLFRLGPTEQFVKAKRWLDDGWNTISTWQSDQVEQMTLTQDRGQTDIKVKVKKFYRMQEDTLTKLYGVYVLQHVPFAIADVPGTVRELQRHIRVAGESYIQSFTKHKSPILGKTFSAISSLIKEPKGIEHTDLLKDTLDLWVANRFIERPWHVPHSQTLDPSFPFGNGMPGDVLVPISPVMDQQLDQIIIQKILNDLKSSIQKRLQKLVEQNKKNNWFIIYLCTFLMLNNYETATVHDYNFVQTNGLKTRFSDNALIERYHVGAKTLLTYFRYYCKGHVPFQLQYKDGDAGKLTPLNEKQKIYMSEMAEYISNQADYFKDLQNSESYHADLHLVSKLFSNDWDSASIFRNLQ